MASASIALCNVVTTINKRPPHLRHLLLQQILQSVAGRRSIIGVSVSLSEAKVHWRDFFNSLVERGLHGIELITSDAHSGLKAAKKSVFPSVKWQRCQFHLQQNSQSHVPKRDMKQEVSSDIRAILHAPNRDEA
jgi:putative transposase